MNGIRKRWIYSYKDGRGNKELRPVFYEELELLGFKNKGWKYPKTEKPLLWAETRRYIYRGRFVAETVGGDYTLLQC